MRPGGIQPRVNTLELKAILVVDDDQQLASALQWILAEEHFFVDVAFDGEEALRKVEAHEYDAVICDLQMPRLCGDEFYLKAREMRPSLSDRFIFITGFATDPNGAICGVARCALAPLFRSAISCTIPGLPRPSATNFSKSPSV